MKFSRGMFSFLVVQSVVSGSTAAVAGTLREDLADRAGLNGAYEWYLAHGDMHGAGETAQSIILYSQHTVAVHGEELRNTYHQAPSLAQVVGLATGIKDVQAFLGVLRDSAAQGRAFSPGSPLNPPEARPPAILDCATIDGETD